MQETPKAQKVVEPKAKNSKLKKALGGALVSVAIAGMGIGGGVLISSGTINKLNNDNKQLQIELNEEKDKSLKKYIQCL